MQLYYHFPFFSIMLPMLVALIMPLLRNEKISCTVSLAVQTVLALLSFQLLIIFLNDPAKSFTYSMGKFPAPWGNELRAGPFEALMSCAFSMVMFFSAMGGARDTVQDVKKGKVHYFYLMINMITASLMALVYTNDIFTGFVFLELNALSACAIVVAKECGETYKATVKYLMLSVLGSGLYMMSTSILYGITGHLLMEPAHRAIRGLMASGQYLLPLTVTLILYSVSIAVKSALFPFHTWLPDAHGNATTSSSAALSGLVLKGYLVLFIKLLTRVYGIDVVSMLGVMPALFMLGLLSMVSASAIALMQKNIKRMVAYSTVAHIGYIFMSIGLDSSVGFAVASFHIIVHAFTKSMLFIAVGSLVNTAGSVTISEMAGVAKKNKIAAVAFFTGAMSLIGFPLFAGFPSKLFMAGAVMQSNHGKWVAVTILALSTFLNALYYLPALFKFCSRGEKKGLLEAGTMSVGGAAKSPFSVSFTLICLIAVNIVLGVFWNPLLNMLERGFAWLG